MVSWDWSRTLSVVLRPRTEFLTYVKDGWHRTGHFGTTTDVQEINRHVYKVHDLAAEIAAMNARIFEVLRKTNELLSQPAPDTFLGRAHYAPFPLTENE